MKQERKPRSFRRVQSPDVGYRLRAIRMSAINPRTGKWYTLQELAKFWRVNYEVIRDYEIGRRQACHEFLIKYSLLGGRSLDWILTGKEPARK